MKSEALKAGEGTRAVWTRVFLWFGVAFGMKVALMLIDEGTFTGWTKE